MKPASDFGARTTCSDCYEKKKKRDRNPKRRINSAKSNAKLTAKRSAACVAAARAAAAANAHVLDLERNPAEKSAIVQQICASAALQQLHGSHASVMIFATRRIAVGTAAGAPSSSTCG